MINVMMLLMMVMGILAINYDDNYDYDCDYDYGYDYDEHYDCNYDDGRGDARRQARLCCSPRSVPDDFILSSRLSLSKTWSLLLAATSECCDRTNHINT